MPLFQRKALTFGDMLAMDPPFEQGPVNRNRPHPDIDSPSTRDSAAPLLLCSDR